VSVLKEDDEDVMDEKGSCITVLVFNALPKYCAPSAVIWFHSRSNDVSVYGEYAMDE